jgi:hypothetical protein
MLAGYGIPFGCSMVILIKLVLKQSDMVKLSNIQIVKIAE